MNPRKGVDSGVNYRLKIVTTIFLPSLNIVVLVVFVVVVVFGVVVVVTFGVVDGVVIGAVNVTVPHA